MARGIKSSGNNVDYTSGAVSTRGRKWDHGLVVDTYVNSPYTMKEVAEILGMPYNTTKNIIMNSGIKKKPRGPRPKNGWRSVDILEDMDKTKIESLSEWCASKGLSEEEKLIRTRVRKYVQECLGADMSVNTYTALYVKDKLKLKALMESEEWKERREERRERSRNQHVAKAEYEKWLAEEDRKLRIRAKRGTITVRQEDAVYTKEAFLEELEKNGHVKIGGI